MEADHDIAFNLQVQEALTASLLDASASPTSPTHASISYDAYLGPDLSAAIRNDNLQEYEQILLDHYKAEAEARRLQLELTREIHDRVFSCDIMKVPEGEWAKTGDDFSRPFGEGTSTSGDGQGMKFRVYVKGLIEGVVGAVAVLICDENDGLMFEMRKGFSGKEFKASEEFFQFKALVEGLEIATVLGLNKLLIHTDCPMLSQFMTGKNPQIPAGVTKLSEQIKVLQRKFSQLHVSLETTKSVAVAHELARNAIGKELERSAASSSTNTKERCKICLEDAYVDQMFQVPACQHGYCFSCMMKHIQYKLLLGVLPKCPHEKCKSELKLDECKKFLTPELFDIMSQRVKEASIPVAEKVYCPYPRCSALLSKTDMERQRSIHVSDNVVWAWGGRKCPVCSGVFCLNCKVPWHRGMDCVDFKKHNTQLNEEDKELKSLANKNLWRQCPKCNHMISLAEGCYHIYCRCGHEFCYTCGAEWKNKKATCICPIWDVRNIVYGG